MPNPSFRRATREDLPAIIALLADDHLGVEREDPRLPLDPAYLAAFGAIERDQNQFPLVMVLEADIVGYLQITFIPGLGHKGRWRGQIENVRIASSRRGKRLGSTMIQWAIACCQKRGCGLVQLTSDRTREDAIRFYERLGFKHTHAGLKYTFTST